MQLPNQSPPVNRPPIVDPNLPTLIHPNPNDPARFLEPLNCGCQLLAGSGMMLCLASCVVTRRF
jgi:hypothetical protein